MAAVLFPGFSCCSVRSPQRPQMNLPHQHLPPVTERQMVVDTVPWAYIQPLFTAHIISRWEWNYAWILSKNRHIIYACSQNTRMSAGPLSLKRGLLCFLPLVCYIYCCACKRLWKLERSTSAPTAWFTPRCWVRHVWADQSEESGYSGGGA